MSLSHTPGPWSAHKTAFGDWSIKADSGPGITVIGDDASDTVEGDARLIAAAPEMLDLLESLYVDLVDYSKRLSGAYDTGAIALGSCADQIAAVVAKAKDGAS